MLCMHFVPSSFSLSLSVPTFEAATWDHEPEKGFNYGQVPMVLGNGRELVNIPGLAPQSICKQSNHVQVITIIMML